MIKNTDNKSALDALVGDAMKSVAQKKYLADVQKENSCDGDVECLVSKNLGDRENDIAVHSLVMTFNYYADYEHAVHNLNAEIERLQNDKAGQRADILDFLNARDPAELDSAVERMLRDFSLVRQMDSLQRMATAYACLTTEWGRAQSWYDTFSVEECTKETIVGNYIMQGFSAMQEKGSLDEWSRLTKVLAPSDDRLKIMEYNLRP